jgi:hypothetical protein
MSGVAMVQQLVTRAPDGVADTHGVHAPAFFQPSIPVLDVGPDFPVATLRAERERADALLDLATKGYPRAALARLDQVSRRWLVKHANEHLAEIDAIAGLLGRPGAYFLSVNYEWGCTVGVKSCPEQRSARLVRVLDWKTSGLGRHVLAARVSGPSGRFVTLTWPGYTGVLQACAPGRFAAALNQAPMPRRGGGIFPLDWAVSKARVWRMPHPTAAHLLREVFERAADYGAARRMLMSRPIAAPAIYSLAGVDAGQSCVIERLETEARVIDGAAVAANHWQASDWHGRPRGNDSHGRRLQMRDAAGADFDPAFPWLKPPILNPRTRLVMIAEPRSGRVMARGYEADGPATAPLDMVA